MKALFLFLLILSGDPKVFCQSAGVSAQTIRDSSRNYLNEIERSNLLISNAYNSISVGLKGENTDSLKESLFLCQQTVEQIIKRFANTEVAEYLVKAKTAYLLWMSNLNQFNLENLSKLLEYYQARIQLLKKDKDADTGYTERQISGFFQLLEEAQVQAREGFLEEVKKLLER